MPLPFIARWTGTIPAGQTTAANISAADFAPTALELAGRKIPENVEGRSLLPILTGEPAARKPAEAPH